jgi:hypothetical protein
MVFLCLVLFVQVVVSAGNVGEKARQIGFGIYVPHVDHPVLSISCAQLRKEHRSVGFFRIGALPMAVAEEVVIEVRDPQYLVAALEQARLALNAGASDTVELRKVILRDPRQSQPVLAVAKVRMLPGGIWQISGGGASFITGKSQSFDEARLHLTGPLLGQLEWSEAGKPMFQSLVESPK